MSAVGKVAVIGSGSVGLYYGGKLAANGVDVHFLLRSGFDEASQSGISIFSVSSEDVHLDRPKIFRDVHEIGRCDVVIVALKATSNGVLEIGSSPFPRRDHFAYASERTRQRRMAGRALRS